MQPVLSLAPLHGVTIRVFRNAWWKHFRGFDRAFAPFIASIDDAESASRNHFKDLLPELNRGVPLVPQLMSNDAGQFVSTAKALAALGYREVNWNLGCPYPMVTRKRRGSGLLPHPDLVDAFLDEACAGSPLPVSVKLRLGFADKAELRALAPVLNRYPLAGVIVHPRVASQMYGGSVDPDAFGEALGSLKGPVCWNGDIRDEAGFAALRERFPTVREWMIGRGALADPFLPARLKGLAPPDDRLGAIRGFLDELYLGYHGYLHSPRHVLDKMKEVWGYLADSFPEPERARKAISKAGTLEAYRREESLILAGGLR